MSMNSRYRERKYNTSDNDRLLRALSQPVQAWERKWTQHSSSKTLQTFKWVKSDKVIEFEQDEESEEEPEPMETETTTTTTVEVNEGDNSVTEKIITSETTQGPSGITVKSTESTITSTNDNATASTTTATISSASAKKEDSIPGGSSSFITNKTVSSLQEEEDDEIRSATPKLDDISDEETNMDNDDDDDNDVDNINDPSKHPALAPHAQAHMSDDENMTDSTAATPQTTEGNTPRLDDEEDHMMEDTHVQPHPLSQEILSGIMVNDDMNSMNNDSPAVQTPEDTISVTHPHNPIQAEQQ